MKKLRLFVMLIVAMTIIALTACSTTSNKDKVQKDSVVYCQDNGINSTIQSDYIITDAGYTIPEKDFSNGTRYILAQDQTVDPGTANVDSSNLTKILEWIGGILLFLIGHVGIKGKWASLLQYAEIVVKWLYDLLHGINVKTNRQ